MLMSVVQIHLSPPKYKKPASVLTFAGFLLMLVASNAITPFDSLWTNTMNRCLNSATCTLLQARIATGPLSARAGLAPCFHVTNQALAHVHRTSYATK
jgi:hypothetical protein